MIGKRDWPFWSQCHWLIALSSRYVDRSFFLTQLERRNIHVAIGPQGYLLELVRTDATMRQIDEASQEDWDLVEKGHYVSAAGTLNTAMTVFERTRAAYLPVVKVVVKPRPRKSWGAFTRLMHCAPITRRCLMPPRKSTVN